MIGQLVAEAAESIRYPCSLLLIVSVAIPGLVGGRPLRLTAAAAVTAMVTAVLRFSGLVGIEATRGALIVAGIVLLGLVGATLWARAKRRSEASALEWTTAVAFGVIGAWLWVPCVGSEFGSLLGDLQGGFHAGASARLVLFMAVLLVPSVVIVALADALSQVNVATLRAVGAIGGLAGVSLALLVITDTYPEIARIGL